MNPEIKQKWTTALRSGDYKQGRACLRSIDNEYCCLGVLCDVIGLEWHMSDNDSILYSISFGGHNYSAFLPEALKNLLNLTTEDHEYLVSLNDTKRWSFRHIANYIEENL
jgi:hypothetical protein